MLPEVEYAQCDPSVTPLRGSMHFAIAVSYVRRSSLPLALSSGDAIVTYSSTDVP